MDFTIENLDDFSVLTFNDALTIRQAVKLHSVLQDALRSAPQVQVNCEQVTEIDLAGLQLLYSARQTAVGLNKTLTLAGPCPAVIKQAIETAGYSHLSPFDSWTAI